MPFNEALAVYWREVLFSRIVVFSLFILLTGCATQTSKVDSGSEIRSDSTNDEIVVYEKRLLRLNNYAGSYPPRFRDDREKRNVISEWKSLEKKLAFIDLENSPTEQELYILGELHRIGHNLDMNGSGKAAMKVIDLCINYFANSVKCHFSASYFYLSIPPKWIHKAKRSLDYLKSHFSPILNEEVESGYVFYFIMKQDVINAKKQIEFFNDNFPMSSRVEMFILIRESLGDSIELKRVSG